MKTLNLSVSSRLQNHKVCPSCSKNHCRNLYLKNWEPNRCHRDPYFRSLPFFSLEEVPVLFQSTGPVASGCERGLRGRSKPLEALQSGWEKIIDFFFMYVFFFFFKKNIFGIANECFLDFGAG